MICIFHASNRIQLELNGNCMIILWEYTCMRKIWAKYTQTYNMSVPNSKFKNVLKNDSRKKKMKLDELIKQNPKLHDIFI